MDSETNFGELGLGVLISALDPSLDALEIADVEGNIVYVNGSWTRLFECAGQDVAGATWDLVRANGAEYMEIKNSWKSCLERGTSQGTSSVSLPDGAEKRCLIHEPYAETPMACRSRSSRSTDLSRKRPRFVSPRSCFCPC